MAALISPEGTLSVYQELMDYIATGLRRPRELKQRRTYQEANDVLGEGKLNAATQCTAPYTHVHRQYNRVQLMAVPVVNGSPTCRSCIIVPQSSTAGSVEDLHKKRFAFTDPLSTLGQLYPTSYLMSVLASLWLEMVSNW